LIWLIITVVVGAVPIAFAVAKIAKDLGGFVKDASEVVKNIAETRDLNAGVGQKRADEAKLRLEADLINEELDLKRVEKLKRARAFAAEEVGRLVSRDPHLGQLSRELSRMRTVETIEVLFPETWLQREAISEFDYLIGRAAAKGTEGFSSSALVQDSQQTVDQQLKTLEERLRNQPTVQIPGEVSPQQNGLGQSSS